MNRINIMILASFSMLVAAVHAYQSSVAMTDVGSPFVIRAHALPLASARTTAGGGEARPAARVGLWPSAPRVGASQDSSRVDTDSLRVRVTRG